MRSAIRRCPECGKYSLKDVCTCGIHTRTVLPARYSPYDRYGEYRRRTIKEAWKNGE